jgi:hypothetical protein
VTSITIENYFTQGDCLGFIVFEPTFTIEHSDGGKDAHLNSFRIPSLAIRFGSIVQLEADLCSSRLRARRIRHSPAPFCSTRAVMSYLGVNIVALTVKVGAVEPTEMPKC